MLRHAGCICPAVQHILYRTAMTAGRKFTHSPVKYGIAQVWHVADMILAKDLFPNGEIPHFHVDDTPKLLSACLHSPNCSSSFAHFDVFQHKMSEHFKSVQIKKIKNTKSGPSIQFPLRVCVDTTLDNCCRQKK